MPQSEPHGYNVPDEGETNRHRPLNDDFRSFDTDIEIRDTEAKTAEYDPKPGAKYYATDTGQVFVGTGSTWEAVESSDLVIDIFDGNGNEVQDDFQFTVLSP